MTHNCSHESKFSNYLFDLNLTSLINCEDSMFAHILGFHCYGKTAELDYNDIKDNLMSYINNVSYDQYPDAIGIGLFEYNKNKMTDAFLRSAKNACASYNSARFYMFFAAYEMMKNIRYSNQSSSKSFVWRNPENLCIDSVFGYNVFVGTYIYRYHLLMYGLRHYDLNHKANIFNKVKYQIHDSFNRNDKMNRLIDGGIANVLPLIAGLTYEQTIDVCNRYNLYDVEIDVIKEILKGCGVKPTITGGNLTSHDEDKCTLVFYHTEEEDGESLYKIPVSNAADCEIEVYEDRDEIIIEIDDGEILHEHTINHDNVKILQAIMYNDVLWIRVKTRSRRRIDIKEIYD